MFKMTNTDNTLFSSCTSVMWSSEFSEPARTKGMRNTKKQTVTSNLTLKHGNQGMTLVRAKPKHLRRNQIYKNQTRVVISNTPSAISAEIRPIISHSSRTDLLFCMISKKYFRLSCTSSSCITHNSFSTCLFNGQCIAQHIAACKTKTKLNLCHHRALRRINVNSCALSQHMH